MIRQRSIKKYFHPWRVSTITQNLHGTECPHVVNNWEAEATLVLLQSSSHGQGPQLSWSWSTCCTETYTLYLLQLQRLPKLLSTFPCEKLIENGDIMEKKLITSGWKIFLKLDHYRFGNERYVAMRCDINDLVYVIRVWNIEWIFRILQKVWQIDTLTDFCDDQRISVL